MICKRQTQRDWAIRSRALINERAREAYHSNHDESLEIARIYRESHREELREAGRVYRETYPETIAESNRVYRENNVDKLRESNRAYVEANSEKVLASKRKYYDNNLDKVKESARKFHAEHPERKRAIGNAYTARNREMLRAVGRAYNKANPGKNRAHTHLRRARKRAALGSFTMAEFDAICNKQRGKCAHCKKKCKLTIDHIMPLSRGGSNFAFNIQALCQHCNSEKHAKIMDYALPSLFDRAVA